MFDTREEMQVKVSLASLDIHFEEILKSFLIPNFDVIL